MDEILRQNYQWLTPPEYHARNAETIERIAKTGQASTLDQAYIRKDGTTVPVSLRIFLVKGLDGKPMGLGSIIKPLDVDGAGADK